jgi:hypothetical protein
MPGLCQNPHRGTRAARVTCGNGGGPMLGNRLAGKASWLGT